MSNWDGMLESARDEGLLPTMYPADLKMPMVSPDDLGRVAARLLTESRVRADTCHVEGPERYSSADVAAAFARALGRPVEVAVTPRPHWEDRFRAIGFSEAAARSYARMTAVVVDGGYEMPDEPISGTVSLDDHVRALVESHGGAQS